MVKLPGCGKKAHLFAWQGLTEAADGYLAGVIPYERVGDKIILSDFLEAHPTICGRVNPTVATPNWRCLCKDCLRKAGYIW